MSKKTDIKKLLKTFLIALLKTFKRNVMRVISSIIEEKHSKYLEYLKKYKESYNKHGFDISVVDDTVRIKGNGLEIKGDSINTFWTGEDVLCKCDYDFYSKDEFVMIDIGLNIGITTLSMARRREIIKIYGYEPFMPTFKKAQINLEKNPFLSRKIEIFNFGLGNQDKILNINFNHDLPGSMSTVQNRFENYEKIERIEIKKASDVLSEIIEKHNENIFLKIDCEGAEDEILTDLDNTGLLKKIKIIIMEWHFKNPQNLIEILRKNNFIVFNETVIASKLGFIRAVNEK